MEHSNFFEKMTLQIPLHPSDVAVFYTLPLVDQEILIEDAKTFVSTKLSALRTIKPDGPALRGSANYSDLVPLMSPPVPPHKCQLKSSYTPSPQPRITRFRRNGGVQDAN